MIDYQAVVGEYVRDYGFSLPNPSIRTSRISAITVSGSVVYVDTSIKNEDTWYRVLGYYDTKYDSTLRSRVLRGVVVRKALYTYSPRSTSGMTTSAT